MLGACTSFLDLSDTAHSAPACVKTQGLTSREAARETPCAWLPAEEVITPRSLCSGVRLAILLYAPRSLKEKTCKTIQQLSVSAPCLSR